MNPNDFDVGHIIRPSGRVFTTVDQLFEHGRPDDKRPRNQSVYLSSDKIFHRYGLTFSKGHIYEVNPIDEGSVHDCQWIGELQNRLLVEQGKDTSINIEMHKDLSAEEIVEHYWNGVESKSPSLEISVCACGIIERCTSEMISPAATNPNSMANAYTQVLASEID